MQSSLNIPATVLKRESYQHTKFLSVSVFVILVINLHDQELSNQALPTGTS